MCRVGLMVGAAASLAYATESQMAGVSLFFVLLLCWLWVSDVSGIDA